MAAQMQCLLSSKNSVTELGRTPEISQFYAVSFELPKIEKFGLVCIDAQKMMLCLVCRGSR